MAINLKTGVHVGREDQEIAGVFTHKSLKKHDAQVRADAIEEFVEFLVEKMKNCEDDVTYITIAGVEVSMDIYIRAKANEYAKLKEKQNE